jgi:hypothetical protein
MPSMVIRRFVYDEMEHQLWVEFTTGRKYVYSDVPPEVADAFRSAFSKGIYFNSRIRNQFPCREIARRAETHS